ncbi:MAG: glycoside hydrolase family 18 [Dysgonamonadaceae bacterium]|jgi:chitinase|nr:glycoside hydrolase family 18 [Dysgonamonadaceae bacterium]
MKTFQKFSLLVAVAFGFFACGEDNYIPGQGSGGNGNSNLPEKVEGRVVGAYVTYYGTSIPDPAYFTHLFYSFAELYIDANGAYKGFKVQGSEARFEQIASLKKSYPDLKICISFTNTVSNSDNAPNGGFSLLAKSDTYRKTFANDCRTFLQKWNLDGVDLDWEFPGLTWQAGGTFDLAVDVANHVLLMKELRATLGSRYSLTYAGYCKGKETVNGGSRYIDIAAVAPYVDFVNIMTYDMDEAPRHQSALQSASAYQDCERAVKVYLDAGMPANKLVLGIPFYGRRSFSTSPMSINYKDIVKLNPQSYKIDNWDEAASVPYVTFNGQYYCGYDNAKSIARKGEWLLAKDMKGMMYWDYDGDDPAGTLRAAVWEATMKK